MSRWLRTAADRAKRATCLAAHREQAKERVRRKQAKRATDLAARREQAHQAHQA